MQLNEPTAIVEPIVLMHNLVADSAEDRMPLNVAVVYQDPHTREWANLVCARVARQVRTEPIRSSWWKLDCLEHPLLLLGAVQAAARADVIIVAIHATETLPFELTQWLETWLERRDVHEGAFVALIGASEASDAGASSNLEYLREVACRGHLHFMSQVKPMAIAFRGGAPESAIVPFHAPQQVWSGGFGRSQDSHDNWGINE